MERLSSPNCRKMTTDLPSLCPALWDIGNRMTSVSHFFKCLTFAALALIVVMSLRPSVSIGDVPNMDKFVHFGAYAVLASLARLGWPKLWGGWTFLGLALFGIGIEIAQETMNLGRTGSLADTAANLLGTVFPLLIFHFSGLGIRR